MRYGILGPLEVWDDGEPVAIGGPQQRAVLALLLVHANQVVSADRLIDSVWGERPPPTARALLHGCIAGLRRALRAERGRTLVTRAPGYLLEVAPGQLDGDRFEQLAEAGEFARALALWRGPAFDGVELEACRVEASRWQERRLTVLEARVEADLGLGRDQDLAAELQILVGEHPLRERLWGQLMRALHGAHRQADALAAYRRVRDILVSQLGVEPGPHLQEIHHTILAGDPLPAQVSQTPAQLPAAVAAFTGRDHDLKRLDEMVACGTAIAVVSGTPGVGKTALTVHWGHSARHRFPDGQLYVNLRGYAAGAPVRPAEALAGFLRELGVPAERIPADPDQAAAAYRSLLAGRKLLVVLDNAAHADQVRPLLPGGPGCLTVVTSRDTLGGLLAQDGAGLLRLDVLAPDDGYALLTRVLGRDRVEAEPEAAAELVRLCARLPLALRIAAANLLLQTRRSIADQVTELATENRLELLAVDGDEHNAVRAAFDLSYRRLPDAARRLFRLLSLSPGPDISTEAAGALAGAPARRLLDRLACAHLIDEHTPGRYTFHDLLRGYAAERAQAEEPVAERDAAAERLYHWYLGNASAAADLLYPAALRLTGGGDPRPGGQAADSATGGGSAGLARDAADSATGGGSAGLARDAADSATGGGSAGLARDAADSVTGTGPRFAGPAQALAWLEDERPNLVAAVVAAGRPGVACLLADTLRGFFQLRRYTTDWLVVAEAALSVAEGEGDQRARAAAHTSLGTAFRALGEHRKALRHYAFALRLARRSGWREAEALSLGNLGIVAHKLGRLTAAARRLGEAIAIDRATGRRAGEANNLAILGNVRFQSGRLGEAAAHLTTALGLHRESGNQHGQALTLTWLGEVELARGRLDRARSLFTEALDGYARIGDRDGQAVAHHCLATVDCAAGQTQPALRHAHSSLTLARDTGDRLTEATALNALGTAHRHAGRHGEAIAHHRHALTLSRDTAARRLEIEALIGLAAGHRAAGERSEARRHASVALEHAARHGYGVLEHHARAQLERC